MKIYVTCKNSGPTWTGPDPIHILYIGTDFNQACEAVGSFVRYERDVLPREPHFYTALPEFTPGLKMEKYYMADGWWKSVFSFEVSDG